MGRVAQICSYDIIFIFLILIFLILNCLAELNRTPFDLLEGESELVSRFNTEFGSRGFYFTFHERIFIFMTFVRFCYYFNIFRWKFSILYFTTIFIRASYPRIKFNEIIELL